VLEAYAEKGASPVGLDLEEVKRRGYEVIADRLVWYNKYLRHDAKRLSDRIYQLVQAGAGEGR